MGLIEFIDKNTTATFFFFILFCIGFYFFLKVSIKHLTIIIRGWPPPHCDADGDSIFYGDEEDDEEDDEDTEDIEEIMEVDEENPPNPPRKNSLTRFDIMRKDDVKD